MEPDAQRAQLALDQTEVMGRRILVSFSQVDESSEETKDDFPTLESIDVLCGKHVAGVPGLHLLLDFVSREEEVKILEQIEQNRWETGIKRRVQHYGFVFDYSTRKLSPEVSRLSGGFYPESFVRDLGSRIFASGVWEAKDAPDQMTVNEYPCGEGIAPHVDTHSAFDDSIASLSLGSLSVMNFFHPETCMKKQVVLPRRSLVVMNDASRYVWAHAIPQRKYDRISGRIKKRDKRVSLTFRKALWEPCNCPFPKHCDSTKSSDLRRQNRYASDVSAEMTYLPSLSKDFVQQFYDNVSDHFSRTRYKPWPKISKFISDLPKGSILIDAGCGNGKYLLYQSEYRPDICSIGFDISLNLAQVCRERKLAVAVGDVSHMPIRSSIADALICIAVLHHIESVEKRIQILKEILRVLKVGGRALVYAWAFEQETSSKWKFSSQDIMVPWYYSDESSESCTGDDDVHFRYCHLYIEKELDSLALSLSGCSILHSYFDCSNWCIEIRRES
jgi:alkylated DNA repair protein alkB family protein 8